MTLRELNGTDCFVPFTMGLRPRAYDRKGSLDIFSRDERAL